MVLSAIIYKNVFGESYAVEGENLTHFTHNVFKAVREIYIFEVKENYIRLRDWKIPSCDSRVNGWYVGSVTLEERKRSITTIYFEAKTRKKLITRMVLFAILSVNKDYKHKKLSDFLNSN